MMEQLWPQPVYTQALLSSDKLFGKEPVRTSAAVKMATKQLDKNKAIKQRVNNDLSV